MTDRKRIYAIHILDEPPDDRAYPPLSRLIWVYRKTRDERVCRRMYVTPRGDDLTAAMQGVGYQVQPFVERAWAYLELPYHLEYRETGVKFEIPGRFESLRAFDALSPLHV